MTDHDEVLADCLAVAVGHECDGYDGAVDQCHSGCGPDASICESKREAFPALADLFPDELQGQLLGYHWIPAAETRDLNTLAERKVAEAIVLFAAAADQSGLLKRNDNKALAAYQANRVLFRELARALIDRRALVGNSDFWAEASRWSKR